MSIPKNLAAAFEEIERRSEEKLRVRQARADRKAAAPPREYRKAIVTFIDILGFKDMIVKRSGAEIGAILDDLRDWSSGDLEDLDDTWYAGTARAVAFSDNVVRVTPIDGDGGDGALFNELLGLVHIQGELANRGVFLRGALTVADIHMSDGVVFGPGLVRAYELESTFSIYPRIIIDPAVIETYFENPSMRGDHSYDDDIKHIDELLRESDDGLFFVDYLKAFQSELDDPSDYPSLLKRHADHISKAAKGFDRYTTAKQKYGWLAKYHNSVIDEMPEYLEDLKVDWIDLMFPNIGADKSKKTKRKNKIKKTQPAGKTTPEATHKSKGKAKGAGASRAKAKTKV